MTEQQNSPGWATYLRVSDEDKQSPERSFAMQRQRIQEQLLIPSGLKFKREYTDMLTGTSPNRKDYQQMLADAEAGRFSHLGLYRADRFGRNAVEGLQSATKLISLGIKLRVANMPTLMPEIPDGFFMFLIQMGLAQREVDVLRQRTADGMEAKLRSGGWPQKAPDGYLNKERQVSSNKYERWVEIDPEHSQVLKRAWDFLLSGQYTLKQICEELAKLGFTRASGRPWVWNDPNSNKRYYAETRLHKIFHNPFYAGWVVSEKFGIKIGEVVGQWKPIVTTDKFERGIEFLHKHDHQKSRRKKHFYLLRNLVWVESSGKQYKMYVSTPSGRSQSYSYYITHAKPNGKKIHITCSIVDTQIPSLINGISVEPELVPDIRKIYRSEISEVTQTDRNKKIETIRRRLSKLREEEAHLGRLLITGKLSEEAYEKLRNEWKEKVRHTEANLIEMERDKALNFQDLEIALILLTNIGTLYPRLDEKQRASLLQTLVKRIIVNKSGVIIDFELNSPFTYLYTLVDDFLLKNNLRRGSDQLLVGAQVFKDRSTDEVERLLFVWRSEERYTYNTL